MTGMVIKRIEFDAMSADDLWSLHVEVSQLLQQRIQAEKLRLEERLKQRFDITQPPRNRTLEVTRPAQVSEG